MLKRWHLIVIAIFIISSSVFVNYMLSHSNDWRIAEAKESFFGKVIDVRSKQKGTVAVKLSDDPKKAYYISNANDHFSKFFEYNEVYLRKEEFIDTIYFLRKDIVTGEFITFFSIRYP
jgi:hypothetical protein